MSSNQPTMLEIIQRMPDVVAALLLPLFPKSATTGESEFNWIALRNVLTSDSALEMYLWFLCVGFSLSFLVLMCQIVFRNNNGKDKQKKKRKSEEKFVDEETKKNQ